MRHLLNGSYPMVPFRFPRWRTPTPHRIDRVAREPGMPASTVDKPRNSVVAQLQIDPEHPHSGQPAENPVLGLIGASARLDGGTPLLHRTTSGNDDSSTQTDIVQALHAQYWQALLDPQASIAQAWDAPERRDAPSSATDVTVQRPAPNTGIETLISGERTVEEVFGPLVPQDTPHALTAAFALESAPEILRLFAPATYQAGLSRNPATLPPELTRREHQVVTVDSPLHALSQLGPDPTS